MLSISIDTGEGQCAPPDIAAPATHQASKHMSLTVNCVLVAYCMVSMRVQQLQPALAPVDMQPEEVLCRFAAKGFSICHHTAQG